MAMQLITGSGRGGDEEPSLMSSKLGWCRFNLHYTLNALDLWYFQEALSFVVKHGYRFLCLYTFDLCTGSWSYTAPAERLGVGESSPTMGRRQSLGGAFAADADAAHGTFSPKEAILHNFGLEAALIGAKSRMVKDSDREALLRQQLDRANTILSKLPKKAVAPPPAPFPPIRVKGRPFFEVAKGMVRNTEGLLKAAGMLPKDLAEGNLEALMASMKLEQSAPAKLMKDPSPLTNTLTPLLATDGSQGPIRRVGLKFSDVGYGVAPGWISPPRQVLQDVSGICRSGEVLFLMGPPGAGKTTLLNCLAGRVSGPPTGQIFFNEMPATPRICRRVAQYCMHDTPFHEALTVEEQLMVAAQLCCPSRNEARRRVEWVIAVLGLSSCRRAKIGGSIFRGIAAGERKRLAIGEKVLVGAPVLFLDEPTSTLDTSNAMQVAQLLQVLASQNGTSIICSIHQTSERVLACADHVLLLASGGRQAYFGSPAGLEDHFGEALGEAKTFKSTPAEWVFDMISAGVGGTGRVDRVVQAWATQGGSQKVKQLQCCLPCASDVPIRTSPFAGLHHTAVLFQRAMINALRNPMVIWARLCMDIALSLVVSTVWWSIGTDVTAGEVDHLVSVLFFVAAFQAFMSIASMQWLMEDKAVFLKEKASGNYGVVCYNVSTFLASSPLIFCIALVCSAIIYFSLGLNTKGGRFFVYVVNLFLTLLCAEAVVFLVASIVPIFSAALAASAFVFGAFMVVEDYFIRFPYIPTGWRWLHWVSFHSYSFRTAVTNQFDGSLILKDASAVPAALENVSGDRFLASFGFEDEDVLLNCQVLVCMVFGYRFLAALWQHMFLAERK